VEVHAEVTQVEIGDGQAQLGDADTRRVSVVARVTSGLSQLFHHARGRGEVGVAEAQVDHVGPGPPQLLLGLVDLGKGVRRQVGDATKVHDRSRLTMPAREEAYFEW